MRQKLISATLGTILCLAAAVPALAQDATPSTGITQAVYAVLASWLGDIEAAINGTTAGPQSIDDSAVVPPNAVSGQPGDGPELTPMITPSG